MTTTTTEETSGFVAAITGTDTDYRDALRDAIEAARQERGLTPYRLCKQAEIDTSTLSNVLAKRRHFSLHMLERVLNHLGCQLTIVPMAPKAEGALAQ